MARAIDYSRTSGEEKDTGQNVGAQAEEVRHAVEALGHTVVESHEDDGVSGDTPPMDWPFMVDGRAEVVKGRPGFMRAVRAVLDGRGDFIAMRDASRFCRAHFAWATIWHEHVPVPLLFLKDEPLTTWNKPADKTPPTALIRGVTFYGPWSTLDGIRTTTQTVMTELKEGRRPTKSGKPPHRPPVVIDPAHLEEARRVYGAGDRGALTAAHRVLLQLREYDPHGDKRVHAARYVSKETLAKALGLRALPTPEATA